MTTNRVRAKRCELLLMIYRRIIGSIPGYQVPDPAASRSPVRWEALDNIDSLGSIMEEFGSQNPREILLGDLIADLHHFANQNDINITRCIRMGKEHFREELEDGGWGAEDL